MTERIHGLEHGLTNYGDRDFSLYLRRSFAQSMGYSRAMLEKPVVGIAYTPSGFNNCHRHFPELLDAVKRGVLAAGALPIEFPTISLGEVFLAPTSLKYRNLMSIDTEEMVRAQPMDAVVLMGGCDKTVPAQLMGAVSAGRPAVMLVAGPMMTGRHRGERLGACTDGRRFWARYRAGDVGREEISQVEGQLAVTAGTCAVMGTASTMACIAEALALVASGDHRTRHGENGWYIHACSTHEQSGDCLVASSNQHDRIHRLGSNHLLGVHRHQVTKKHAGWI